MYRRDELDDALQRHADILGDWSCMPAQTVVARLADQLRADYGGRSMSIVVASNGHLWKRVCNRIKGKALIAISVCYEQESNTLFIKDAGTGTQSN